MDTPTSAASESRQVSPDVSDVSNCLHCFHFGG